MTRPRPHYTGHGPGNFSSLHPHTLQEIHLLYRSTAKFRKNRHTNEFVGRGVTCWLVQRPTMISIPPIDVAAGPVMNQPLRFPCCDPRSMLPLAGCPDHSSTQGILARVLGIDPYDTTILSGNSQQLRNAELVVIGELAVESLVNPRGPHHVQICLPCATPPRATPTIATWMGRCKPIFSLIPFSIVMIPLDQLDPRPSVRNMACLPQINPKEPPYTDAGLTREEMEALVARYRRQGRADEGVDGGSFLIGFGVATVLLWASVSWLWSLVFA